MSRVTDTGFPSYKRLYRADVGGSGEGFNTPGQRYTERETFRVARADYVSLTAFIEGTLETVGGPFGTMVRRVPLRHPEYPQLIATGYTSKRVGYNASATFWAWYDVTITFATPNFALDGQNAFINVRTSATQRQVEAPPAMFRMAGLAPTFDPEYPAQGTKLSLSTHQLPTLPLATYAAYQGSTNNAVFWGYPIGTVLYNGPSSDRSSRVGGTETYEVTHEFEHSIVPWNYAYNAAGAQVLMTYGSGTLRYPLQDLNQLFA